jgi:hypothetical protein
MSWAESEKLNEWIERAYQNGRQEEQERIIKLLENDQCKPTERFHFAPCACKYIALIKGKNK